MQDRFLLSQFCAPPHYLGSLGDLGGRGGDVIQSTGSRIRMFRKGRKLSQAQLGKKLGVTFQQVQKYENGKNRVGASRLQMISTALDVPVGQFFTDGAGTGRRSAKPPAFDPQALRFAEAFIRLNDSALRNSILDMVEAMARKTPRI
jgi:transcriptional regulator with XRE-family HTH domain